MSTVRLAHSTTLLTDAGVLVAGGVGASDPGNLNVRFPLDAAGYVVEKETSQCGR